MDNSLNDLQLNNSMLAALYGRSLVQIEAKEMSPGQPVEKAVQPLKFLGNNSKKVTILVNNPDIAFLPENQLALLTKMLGACQMNTGDVAIVNMASGITEDQVTFQLSPVKIITFGIHKDTIHFKTENRKGIEFLNSPALDELVAETEEARQLKGKLWAGLKELFRIG